MVAPQTDINKVKSQDNIFDLAGFRLVRYSSLNIMDALQQDLQKYQNYTCMVTDDATYNAMKTAIESAWIAWEKGSGEVDHVRCCLAEAKRCFNKARKERKVAFYGEGYGISFSMIFLGVSLVLTWILQVGITKGVLDQSLIPVLAAIEGGVIGGVAAVLSAVSGITVDTQAITAQKAWFVIKPLLAGIIGYVTYLAVMIGIAVAASTNQLNTPQTFLVGFLGGYLESFSTRLLSAVSQSMEKS